MQNVLKSLGMVALIAATVLPATSKAEFSSYPPTPMYGGYGGGFGGYTSVPPPMPAFGGSHGFGSGFGTPYGQSPYGGYGFPSYGGGYESWRYRMSYRRWGGGNNSCGGPRWGMRRWGAFHRHCGGRGAHGIRRFSLNLGIRFGGFSFGLNIRSVRTF